VYSYERAEKLTVKAKGVKVPTKKELEKLPKFEQAKRLIRAKNAIEDGTPVPSEGIIGFKDGARHGRFFVKKKGTRRVNHGFGDRILEPGKDVTRAPTIEELTRSAEDWDRTDVEGFDRHD
jgi:hypothetical protein